MKFCSKCRKNKELEKFCKNKNKEDGYNSTCKLCTKEYKETIKEKTRIQNKEWNLNNKEKVRKYKSNLPKPEYIYNPQKHLEWYNNPKNREKKSIYSKIYALNNIDKHKIYCINNREKINNHLNNKYKLNIQFKLGLILRNRIKNNLKRIDKNNSTLDILGCSLDFFKLYLEKQFLPEMTWENHGLIWEIDHIIGCCNFDLTNPNQQAQCFHYSNQQPLFKTTAIAESFGYLNEIGNRNKSKKLSI